MAHKIYGQQVLIVGGDNPLIATSDEEMQSLFTDDNVGKFVQYTGETETYIKNAFYQIVDEADAAQYYELPILTNPATAKDVREGKEFINSKGEKVVGTLVVIGTLEETSWNTIRETILAGKATNYWKVGDTKSITSKSGKNYTIRLCDLQDGRYEYSDGSGSSKAAFEFVELYNLTGTTGWKMNSKDTSTNGWRGSLMKTSTMATILADLPDDMVAAMSEVKVLSGTGGGSTRGTSSSDNKLFLPAEMELFSSMSYSIGTEECPLGQFDYYKANDTNADRIKYIVGTTTAQWWWERSPYSGPLGYFCVVKSDGSAYRISASYSYGVAPIFAI